MIKRMGDDKGVDLDDLKKGAAPQREHRTIWSVVVQPVWTGIGRGPRRFVRRMGNHAAASWMHAKSGASMVGNLGWVLGTTAFVIFVPLYRAIQFEYALIEQSRMATQMYPGFSSAGATPLAAPSLTA